MAKIKNLLFELRDISTVWSAVYPEHSESVPNSAEKKVYVQREVEQCSRVLFWSAKFTRMTNLNNQ